MQEWVEFQTADNLMALCNDDDLPQHECGTVISCFWSKSEFERPRPQASESNATCCYRISIKEKGDCDTQEVQMAGNSEVRLESGRPDVTPTVVCQNSAMPWMIASFLLCIVAIQSAYIIWVCVYRPSHKISQSNGSLTSQVRSEPQPSSLDLSLTHDFYANLAKPKFSPVQPQSDR
ncbi:hypothetical protein WR25_11376 [Diploscapter pachys]|uniref:Uncharacterized protein n=1 Tax=Diploscapter pachys TaxID=2018661 RepID=A0A2A2LJG8_9BILA|nr:hypothetical protein WR25_11376 [Diploscapter pachys]